VDKSAVIVVAEVTRILDSPGEYVRAEKQAEAKLYAAEISVREVLKGTLQPGTMVVGGMMPITPSQIDRGAALQAGMVRTFFLVREQNSWRFADPFYGVMVATPVTPRPKEGSAVEKVMQQLLAALQSDLIGNENKRELASQLRAVQDPRVTATLRSELEKSHDDELTMTLLSVLIGRNDPMALTKAREFLKTSNSKHVGSLILSMANLQRADLLPEIASGLQSARPQVRIVSAMALVQSRVPEAEVYISPLLDDPDRRLVTQVMVSLAAKYNHPEWAPEWQDDKRWDDMRQHWRDFLQSPHPQPGPAGMGRR
jgi:hypothetical protein